MSELTKKNLLDATAGIRPEYIEEAAAPAVKSRPHWVRFAAAAAMLALLLGGMMLLWPDSNPQADHTPFFAIRAYAQDGTEATLDRAGDSSVLVSAESDLFPGKQTYMLEIYLTNTDGSKVNLADYSFYCFHRGKYLEPGDSDEFLSVQFIQEDGIYGYRIIGWCEASDAATISVRNQENLIVYQRDMYVVNNGEYTTRVDSVYNYEAGIPTEKLIDKILAQNFTRMEMLSSSFIVQYSHYANHFGGFWELEQREDAPSLLLQRWLTEMEENKDMLHKYQAMGQTGLVGKMLAEDVFWNGLTEAQRQQIQQFGLRRWLYKPVAFTPFPEKEVFQYEILVDGPNYGSDRLEIHWPGRTDENQSANIVTVWIASVAGMKNPYHGWEITGWFDEPTELTLTVTDKDSAIIRQDVLLITPAEDGYQIDILAQTP